MKWILGILKKWWIIKFILNVLDKITLPGFENNSVLSVSRFFFRNAFDENLNLRSSYLAYNFFLALFPTIIFFFTALAYVPIKDIDDKLLNEMQLFLPTNVYETLKLTISDILSKQRSGLLSFGFLLALYFASNGFLSMIRSFNRYKKRKVSPIKDRIKSIALTFLISIILVLSFSLIIFTNLSIQWLDQKTDLNASLFVFLYRLLEYGGLFLLLYLIFSALYFIGSGINQRWNFFSPGSTLASILSFITTITFTYYVNNFDSYNKLYGSIGTIISLMLLIYFNCVIILIGFELNYSIFRASKEKTLAV